MLEDYTTVFFNVCTQLSVSQRDEPCTPVIAAGVHQRCPGAPVYE